MKKKNLLILFFIVIAVVLLTVVGIISFSYFNSKHDDKIVSSYNSDDITRFEWIEMLAKQFGFTEYENTQPVFSDVDSACEYFKYIQSAAQWKVLEEDELFEGDKIASGYFIALTSMKTIGDYKLQIYLGDTRELSDSDYIDIAIDNQMIAKDDLERGFSKTECRDVIQKILFLANEKFWVDGIEEIEYKEGISEKDALSMTDANLEDVIEKATISEKTILTFDDMANFYGWTTDNAISTSVRNVDNSSDELDFLGFTVEVNYDIDTDEVSLKYTNKKTGLSWEEGDNESNTQDTIGENKITASISFSDINVDYQTVWDWGLKYQDVNLSYKSDYTTSANVNVEKTIPLLPRPYTIGAGRAAGVELQLYVLFKAKGKVEVISTINGNTGVCYENGKGIRTYYNAGEHVPPTIQAACDVGGYLRGEVVPWLLTMPILDFETDIGVEASGSVVQRANSQLCADLSVSFPNIIVQVSGDNELEPKTILALAGISLEKKIYGPDSVVDELTEGEAPYLQFNIHFEEYPNGTGQLVDKCTWNDEAAKGEEAAEENAEENADRIVDMAQYYKYDFPVFLTNGGMVKDEGDYYSVTGDLYAQARLTSNEFEVLNFGDVYKMGKYDYIKGDEVSNQEYELEGWKVFNTTQKDTMDSFYMAKNKDNENYYYLIRNPESFDPSLNEYHYDRSQLLEKNCKVYINKNAFQINLSELRDFDSNDMYTYKWPFTLGADMIHAGDDWACQRILRFDEQGRILVAVIFNVD